MNQTHRKPLLLLDVDGVLNPYPHTPEGYFEFEFFPEDDEPVRLNPLHAAWLRELAASFDIAWASAWGQTANESICPVFALPAFPFIALPTTPFEPREKVSAVVAFAADRAAAWVDDIVTDEARAWATERRAPTLIIEANPAAGLTRENVDRLLAWAAGLTSSVAAQD